MSEQKDLVTIIGEALSKKKTNISQTEAPIKTVPNMTGSENQKPIAQPQTTPILNSASMRPKNTRGVITPQ